MKVYLDDVRPTPSGWTRTYTAPETIEILSQFNVEEISLDHDLGENPEVGTGYDVLIWIEEQIAYKKYKPPVIHIHTDNPPARIRMNQAVDSIRRLWDRCVQQED